MPTFDELATAPSGARATPMATLPKNSFLDVPFRCTEVQIRGGIDEVVHKYPRLPGGKTEPLGRKLYEFNCQAHFMVGDREFPTAWPGDEGLIRAACEQQIAGDLVLSIIGKVRARAISWTLTQSSRVMNGVSAQISFREESQNDVLTPGEVVVLSGFSIQAQTKALIDACERAKFKHDFITDILNYAGAIQAMVERSRLQLDGIANRATALADMIRSFDALEKDLNKPSNWRVVAVLHNLIVTLDKVARDSLSKFAPLITWVTPTEMSVVEVSVANYGDTSRAVEVMRLNTLRDPMKIAEGTSLRIYADISPGGILRAA